MCPGPWTSSCASSSSREIQLGLRTNSLIYLRLRTLLLPQCFQDAGSKHKRKIGNAAKSLTWRRYLVAGIGFEPMTFRL